MTELPVAAGSNRSCACDILCDKVSDPSHGCNETHLKVLSEANSRLVPVTVYPNGCNTGSKKIRYPPTDRAHARVRRAGRPLP